MIVQAVSLLDDLDKELNNYIMRCRVVRMARRPQGAAAWRQGGQASQMRFVYLTNLICRPSGAPACTALTPAAGSDSVESLEQRAAPRTPTSARTRTPSRARPRAGTSARPTTAPTAPSSTSTAATTSARTSAAPSMSRLVLWTHLLPTRLLHHPDLLHPQVASRKLPAGAPLHEKCWRVPHEVCGQVS